MPGKKTSGKEHAALALASGKTVLEAAAAGGVDERTIYKWKEEPSFTARVTELRSGMISDGCGRLSAALAGAVDVLVELSKTGERSDAVKLQAAKAIIDGTLRVTEQTELRQRMEALEAQLAHATKESAK